MPSPSNRRYIAIAVKLLIVGLVIWGVWSSTQTSIKKLEASDWKANPQWISISGILYCLGLLPAAFFWRRIMASLQQKPPLIATLRAYFIGHLGKYVPGKALVVILRSGLMVKSGIRLQIAVVSVFIETLTMMAVGAFLAASITLVLLYDKPELWAVGIGLMLVAGLPTIPPIFNRILVSKWMVKKTQSKMNPNADSKNTAEKQTPSTPPPAPKITWRLTGEGWMMNIVGWFLMGLSCWAVLKSLDPDMPFRYSDLPYTTAGVALAMVAGFLSGLPGGILVRDGILLQVLGEMATVTEENALVAVILLRIIWLVTELAISGMMYLLGQGQVQHPNGS